MTKLKKHPILLPSPKSRRRRGAILVLLGLLLLSLVGMLGLVIDSGLLLSQSRHLQGVADAAALAAARDLLGGRSGTDASATARLFVSSYNAISAVGGGDVFIPPASGPYAGRTGFAEVVLLQDMDVFFVSVLPGISSTQRVRARAVAGYEAVSAGEGLAVLDPNAHPGLSVSGGANIRVNGRVIVNSEGGGVDENGVNVNNGNNGLAAQGGQPNSTEGIYSTDMRVVGGVDLPGKFYNIDAGEPSPLRAKQLPEPDPFVALAVPTTADGVLGDYRGTVTVDSKNASVTAPNFRSNIAQTVGPYNVAINDVVLYPGVYGDMQFNGGNTWLLPGVYVLSPQGDNQKGFSVSSTGGENTNVVGNGVMLYITGRDYVPGSGAPDSSDGDVVGNLTTDMASFKVNGGNIDLRPISRSTNSSNAYNAGQLVSTRLDGMLLFQRRANSQGISVVGNSADANLFGTLYARSANVAISGQVRCDGQVIVGSLAANGGAQITILAAGGGRGKANQIFLVE